MNLEYFSSLNQDRKISFKDVSVEYGFVEKVFTQTGLDFEVLRDGNIYLVSGRNVWKRGGKDWEMDSPENRHLYKPRIFCGTRAVIL